MLSVEHRRLEVAEHPLDRRQPGRHRAVQLAHEDRMLPAVLHLARTLPGGGVVDEGTQRPLDTHHLRDHVLVEPVLERDHDSVRGEQRGQRRDRGPCVVALHGQEHRSHRPLHLLGQRRADGLGERFAGPRDAQTVGPHRRDVLRDHVHQQRVVAGPREPGPNQPPDRARPPDHQAFHQSVPTPTTGAPSRHGPRGHHDHAHDRVRRDQPLDPIPEIPASHPFPPFLPRVPLASSRQNIWRPPSTLRICPVHQPARSDAKKRTAPAMSSGVPNRRNARDSTSPRWPSSP